MLYVKVNEDGTLASPMVYTKKMIADQIKIAYTDDMHIPENFQPFEEGKKPTNLTKYQVVFPGEIKKVNEIWTREYSVLDASDKRRSRVDGEFTQKANEIRVKKLAESDWTQLPDAPLSDEKKEEWKIYRQQLRDISQHPGYPLYHPIPKKPE